MTTTGTIKSQTAFALFRMMHHLPFEYDFFLKEGCIIHYNRETLVKQAIKSGCTHILFVDSDMFFEADAVIRMLEKKKDIIGAHYNRRQLPPVTTVKIEKERWANMKRDNPEGYLTCEAVGAGFLLINLDVFKKIKEPWFFWKTNDKGDVVMGEDHWFCEKAKEAGYEIWADLTTPVKHIGDFSF